MSTHPRKIVFMGVMLAVMLVLSMAERLIPPMPLFLPMLGSPGLANIAVMYVIFFIGKKEALLMAVVKAGFAVLTRGPMAGLLSLSGGLLSVGVIVLLLWASGDALGHVIISMAGAVGHNLGQLTAVCIIMQSGWLFVAYLPFLLIGGLLFGTITGILLKTVMPVFKALYKES